LWFKIFYLSPPYTLPICQGGLQRCLKFARTLLTCHCRFCFALRLLLLHCRLFTDMADEESDGEEYESGRCCTLCRREHLTRLRFTFLPSMSIAPSSSSAFFDPVLSLSPLTGFFHSPSS
jgi:hypothetical protein